MSLTKIKPRDIQQDGASTNDVLTWTGTEWEPATPSGSGDILNGGNTTGATVVIGTNDAQSLAFETNGSTFFTANSSGEVGIGTTPTSGVALTILKLDTSTSGTPITTTIKQTQSPSSNSSASPRALNMGITYNAAGINFTGSPQAGWFENRLQNVGDISNIYGITTSGILMGSDAATVGTITNATGIQTSGTSSFSNSISGTVTNARGMLVNNSLKASLTITNQIGINISALSAGTNNTSILIGTNTAPSGNWGIYQSESTINNVFVGSTTLGATSTPDSSAILDIVSTTKGLGFPSMTTTQRNAIGSPRDGLVVYDSTIDALYLRANGAWVELADGTDSNGIYSGSGNIPDTTSATIADDGYFAFKYFAGDSALVIDDTSGITITSVNTDNELIIGNSGITTNIVGGGDFMVAPGLTKLVYTGGDVTVGGSTSSSELRFLEPSGGGTSYTGFKAPALAANLMYTLPTTATNGYFLKYNSSGSQLEWAAAGNGIYGGSGTVSGTTTASLASSAALNFNYSSTNNALSISDVDGTVTINNNNVTPSNIIVDSTITLNVAGGAQIELNTTTVKLNSVGGNIEVGGGSSSSELRFLEPSGGGSSYTGFKAGAMSSNQIYTLPTDTPSNGEFLRWNTGGTLDWAPGLNGIYGGSGTIPAATAATLTSSSTFDIAYNGGNSALSVSDSDTSITMFSKDIGSFVYVKNNLVQIESNAAISVGIASDNALTFSTGETQFAGPVAIAPIGGASSIDANALLQLDSTTSALLLSRLTTTQRDALTTPPDGLLLYNTTTDKLTIRANGAWVELGTGGGISDGDYGDITVSSSGTVWNIDSGAVGNTELASGTGGIYKGSGTIASGATATLPSSGTFTIAYNGANPAIQVNDTDASVVMYDKTQTNYVYAAQYGVDIYHAKDIILNPAPSTDHAAFGLKIYLTANENQNFGDVVYINSDGEAQLADADAIATASVVGMCTGTVTTGNTGTYLIQGTARDDSWSWTVGGLIYLSTTGTTGNTLTQTAPSGVDDVVQVIGVALHADRMLFTPSLAQAVHV